MSEQQRKVETVEDFKVRIAAIIRAKPEEILLHRDHTSA
jgi:hypothetical protein